MRPDRADLHHTVLRSGIDGLDRVVDVGAIDQEVLAEAPARLVLRMQGERPFARSTLNCVREAVYGHIKRHSPGEAGDFRGG